LGVIPVGINFLSTILIVINTTNNKSDGASDNASGVVCVLELLNFYLKPELRLKNFNLKFVFTGAEECGTMGIRHFCDNLGVIDKKKSYIINFDAIGRVLAYFSSSINANKNSVLYEKITKNAESLDLRFHHTTRSFGIRSDGLYLKRHGFHGFGFGDLDVYKYIHSINDTIDKVDTALLEKLCILLTNILKEIDNQY
jgi:Zn-dependent M28 family amino/carboxypeptidase